ncbi:MAG: glycosyltransferase [Anaerolineaceae bacterium]|nr:glycosyltransferase [Anaerolineaceae bacterium]
MALSMLLLFMVLILTVGLVISFSNLIHVKRFDEFSPAAEHPFVSILVPARDEERNIEACVRSLLAQNYPNFEVIVLNDHSSDATGAILQRLAAADPRLRVVNGAPLPEDWPGKHWACHQLAQIARGEYILFTDADTRHAPHALSGAVAAALQEHADLVTAIPREEVLTWGEKLLVPFMSFGIVSYLPLHFVQRHQFAPLSVTIGQFMLFRRSAYEAVGGYEGARLNVNDDVLLGRNLIERGYRWMVLDGNGAVTCRMYHNFGEAVEGFSKNVFGFFDYRILPYVLVWSAAAFLFVEPLRLLAMALLGGWMGTLPALLAAVAVFESFFLFFLAYRRLGIPLYMAFFYWLTVALFALVAMRSMVFSITGHASWKGRTLKNVDVRWI